MARRTHRQDRLFQRLQEKILLGELAPGSRIPPRTELAKTYRMSPLTVQRAFDRLVEEGYVHPRGRNGSFVAEAPPHLNNYWLIFPDEAAGSRSPFRHALTRESQKLARKGREIFSVHVGHGGNFRQGDFESLLHDVTTHRTAGLIFATAGRYWNDTPLRKEPDLPRVAFSHGPEGPEDIALVRFDRESFFYKALDRLQSLGRSRVAVLACSLPTAYRELLMQGLARRGMRTQPYWIQSVHSHGTHAARSLVHLLMNPDQRIRPDALIIMDDALIDSATAGLLDAGVKAPDELAVVAHTNFPHPVEGATPVIHLGYDVAGLLAECLKLLAAQRNEEPYPHVTLAPALFAEELERAVTPVR